MDIKQLRQTVRAIRVRAATIAWLVATAGILSATTAVLAANQVYVAKDLYTLGAPTGFSSAAHPSQQGVAAGPDGQVVGNSVFNGNSSPVVWDPATTSGVGLYIAPINAPNGGGSANGTDGQQQVGFYLNTSNTVFVHAALWNSSAASMVDITPVQLIGGTLISWGSSNAFATDGDQQVGMGRPLEESGNNHALLWSGTGASYIDLNPTGFTSSAAQGVANGQQVGFGLNTSPNRTDALLWNGLAASAVDLNPSGATSSLAFGTDGQYQVGYSFLSSDTSSQHALLWNGSANSFVDLGHGIAYSVRNGKQLGLNISGQIIMWSGTAASMTNLSALLPRSYFDDSFGDTSGSDAPVSLDANGNAFAVVRDQNTQLYHSIEWSPESVGDMNLDGKVSVADVQAMMVALSNVTQYASDHGVTAPSIAAVGDVDQDGKFTNKDIQSLISNLANAAAVQAMTSSVPEPSSRLLLFAGGIMLAAFYRRVF